MPKTGQIRHSPFAPAWWLPNGHLQTIWSGIFRRIQKPPTRRERLELPDGDFIDLDWTLRGSGPIVIVLHGLQGSLNSNYARGIVSALDLRGFRAVFMHFRGCSGVPNRLARFYHAGDTGDLNFLVEVLHRREPLTPLAAVGYSLGGNVLLKWLGEQGAETPLKTAVAVSVPFDLSNAAERLEQGFSRTYQRWLLNCLRYSLRQKFSRMSSPIDLSDAEKLLTMRAYDNAVTAPLHGFPNAEEYYQRSSSRRYLEQIRVPTLILHAEDDPFMTTAAIPRPDELSPHVTLEVSKHGGHVGFINGPHPWEAQYWLEQRIPDYLQPQLKSVERAHRFAQSEVQLTY